MKKTIIITIALLLGLTFSASAQQAYSSGSWLVDGQAFYLKTGGDAYADTDRLNFDLALGKAVSDGMFIGGTFSLASISTDYYDDTEWLIGGFFRYYLGYKGPGEISSSKPVNPFFGVALKFSNEDSVTLLSFEPSVGVNILMTESVGLEIAAKLAFDRYSYSGNSMSGYNLLIGAGFTKFIF